MNLCTLNDLAGFRWRNRSYQRKKRNNQQQSNCNFHGFLLSASADELRDVERHRGEASWCGAGARTRRKLRQSSGGWGGTPSKSSVPEFRPRFTRYRSCFVRGTASAAPECRLQLLAQSNPEEYVQPKFGPIVPLRRICKMKITRFGLVCIVAALLIATGGATYSQE